MAIVLVDPAPGLFRALGRRIVEDRAKVICVGRQVSRPRGDPERERHQQGNDTSKETSSQHHISQALKQALPPEPVARRQ
jgi:hypothetical protein